MKNIDEQIEELMTKAHATTYVELAKKLDVTAGTIQGWKTRKKIPNRVLRQIENMYPAGQIQPPRPVAENKPPYQATENMVNIPQYDLMASAGHGSYVVAENPVANFSFSNEWITKQGLHQKQLTVVPVHGDSMESTLSDGDLLLVSMIDYPQSAREGICVLRYCDEIFVKRIQFDWKGRGYKVTSDNKLYEEFYVDESDIINGLFNVVGKVERVLQRAKNLLS